MNVCCFSGNLVTDVNLKQLNNGTSVANFRMAVTGRQFKRGDELVKEPAFLELEIWDSGAEVLAKNFKKGSPIEVHCSVTQQNWEKDGQKRSKLVFRVNNFYFVPRSPKAKDSESVPVAVGTSEDEDIAF